VSGYVLGVDNSQGSDINIVKLPLAHELATFDDIKMSIRGGFNYASVDSKNILEGISADTVKPTSEAYSGLVGLLFAVPLVGLPGYPLTGVIHTDHTAFLGKNSNALGFLT